MLTSLVPAPYRWLALIALAWALFGYGYIKGEAKIQGRWDAAIADQKLREATIKAKQAEATVKVVTEYVDRVRVVREKGDTITKEIPVYVQADSCPMPSGFRLLHDSAATGNPLPDPATIPNAATVPAQIAATTITDNYTACRQNAEQLIALQAWLLATSQAKE